MDSMQFEGWLGRYGRAWEGRDPNAAAALFDEAAEYYETPFEPPFRGREEIRRYWSDATSAQGDIAFSHEALAFAANTGVAHWSAEFRRTPTGRRVRLDGVFVLTFDEAGLCSVLREWWHSAVSNGG